MFRLVVFHLLLESFQCFCQFNSSLRAEMWLIPAPESGDSNGYT